MIVFKKIAKFIIFMIAFLAFSGCESLQTNADNDDIKRCVQLADSIELNGSRLVVTNGQLYIIFSQN